MKITGIWLILLFLFSCGSPQRGIKDVITYRFNGQVFIKTSDCLPNLKKVLPLKSKLILMKQDSAVITETTTDSLGNFDTMVAIDTSWTSLLLKVKGLEDCRVDTVIKRGFITTEYDFLCSRFIYDSIQTISLNSNSRKSILVKCGLAEWVTERSH